MGVANSQGPPKTDTQGRILGAAAGLFAKAGYRGTSTRDIATAASVNEVTLFRYYPRKRDLYIAVLDAELQKITLRGDLLARIADAQNSGAALAHTFELMVVTLADKPELVRLVQYGALELNSDFDPILRHHVGQLLEVVSGYLDPWIMRGDLRCNSSKALVLALIAIILVHDPLDRIFSVDGVGRNALFDVYAQLCGS